MTAHPKICPTTGELHFFGYALTPPYLTYHCADATGRLIRSTEIDVPGPTMMHDFAITATHVVFFDLPVVFDIERALAGTMPFRWDDNYGARIGLLPRNQPDAHVTWHDIEPCYVFHVLNAYDSDDGVVIDALRYPELWRTGPDQFGGATLHRWTLPRNGSPVRETPIDDNIAEFPRIDDRYTGLPHRYGYAIHHTDPGRRTDPSLRPPRRHDRHHLGRTRTHPERSRVRTRQPRRRRTRRIPPHLRLRRQLRDQRAGDPARRRTNLTTRRNGAPPATRPVRLPRKLDPGQPVTGTAKVQTDDAQGAPEPRPRNRARGVPELLALGLRGLSVRPRSVGCRRGCRRRGFIAASIAVNTR